MSDLLGERSRLDSRQDLKHLIFIVLVVDMVGLTAHCELVEDQADRKEIAAVAHEATRGLFGSHVKQRALDGAVAPTCKVIDPGEPEVEDLHLARRGQHHVLGLEIPMDKL